MTEWGGAVGAVVMGKGCCGFVALSAGPSDCVSVIESYIIHSPSSLSCVASLATKKCPPPCQEQHCEFCPDQSHAGGQSRYCI